MAEILKARDTSQPGSPIVAVKRILPHLTEDRQYATMFLDESRVLAKLEHENVIRTLEVGQVGETPFIALEYVFGQDARMLFHRSRRTEQKIPIGIACFIIAQCCDALHYAHEAKDAAGNLLGLVHRDVSLQNVLLSYDGDVKLTDFGIAMSAENVARTEVGIVKGKFGYMSPEQIKGEPMDRRSDVFAAGICLYELLTTERLFSGDSDYAAVERVRNVAVEPPSRFNREVPSSLEAIVMKALAKLPRDRYQTAAELRRALLAFMAESHHEASRKDLGEHMRKMFADELAKHPSPEALRSEPKRRTDELTGLAAFDDLDPVSAMSSPSAIVPTPASVAPPRGSRRGPQVPPVVPHRDSVPAGRAAGNVLPLHADGDDLSSDRTVRMPATPGLGVDWDDEELTTGTERVDGVDALPRAFEDEDSGEHDVTRQLYVGETFSGVTTNANASEVRPASVRPPPAVDGAPSPFAPRVSASVPPAPSASPTSAIPPSAQASYATVVAIVCGIIAIIAIALYATRGSRPAQVHLSTVPVDAEVVVDGKRAPGHMSPFVVSELAPSVPHHIEVSRAGYTSWSSTLVLDSAQVIELPKVTLEPLPAPPASAPKVEPPKVERSEASEAPPESDSTVAAAREAQPAPEGVKAEPAEEAAARARSPATPSAPRAGSVRDGRHPKAATVAKKESLPAPAPLASKKAAPASSAAAASGTGVLRINSIPWSEVTVDGRRIGNTPQLNLVLPAGTHVVRLRNPQFKLKKTLQVHIVAGQVVSQAVQLQ